MVLFRGVFIYNYVFLFLYCEGDTPKLLLEIQKRTIIEFFFKFCAIVKFVMVKNLRFRVFSRIARVKLVFTLFYFTITAISCDV